MKNATKKGFTLIEILVVIIIIGILLIAFLPKITSSFDKSKEAQAKMDLRHYQTAAETMMRENSGFCDILTIDSTSYQETVNSEFWSQGLNIEESGSLEVTASIIRCLNSYLDSQYRFNEDSTSEFFGESEVKDPWGQRYQIYFLARNVIQTSPEITLNTDRIYITSSGKTHSLKYPDCTLLVQYQDGEVRSMWQTESVVNSEYTADYREAKESEFSYCLLQDLFTPVNPNGQQDSFFLPAESKSIFNFMAKVENVHRTFVISEKNGVESTDYSTYQNSIVLAKANVNALLNAQVVIDYFEKFKKKTETTGGQSLDSTAKNPTSFAAKTKLELANTGVDVENGSWRIFKSSNKNEVFWTNTNIDNLKIGDKVKVFRYDILTDTYEEGETIISQNRADGYVFNVMSNSKYEKITQ